MKVAIFHDQHLEAGGGFSQSLTAVLDFASILPSNCELVVFSTFRSSHDLLQELGVKSIYIPFVSFLKSIQWVYLLLDQLSLYFLLKWVCLSPLERIFSTYGVDLVYFVSPTWLPLTLLKTPFISTIWDLAHIYYPYYPEVSHRSEASYRESINSRLALRSSFIVVDSVESAEQCSARYSIPAARFVPVPFKYNPLSLTSTSDARTSNTFYPHLPDLFIYYPAHLWSHKNHFVILKAIAHLRTKLGISLHLVLTGNDRGYRQLLERQASSLSISDLLVFLGFVHPRVQAHIYSKCLAVVNASYFGPTNIPQLEAFYFQAPTILANTACTPAQVGRASLIFEPFRSDQLASHLFHLYTNPCLRRRLVSEGSTQLRRINSPVQLSFLEESLTQLLSRIEQCSFVH